MVTVIIAVIAGLLLFLLGYHLGHQIGCTEHIRQRLSRDRRQRQRNNVPVAPGTH